MPIWLSFYILILWKLSVESHLLQEGQGSKHGMDRLSGSLKLKVLFELMQMYRQGVLNNSGPNYALCQSWPIFFKK